MPQYPLLLMRSSCASQVALTANDPAEATAAAEVLAAFCEEYREGQQMLAATFAPPQALSTQHKGQQKRHSHWLHLAAQQDQGP